MENFTLLQFLMTCYRLKKQLELALIKSIPNRLKMSPTDKPISQKMYKMYTALYGQSHMTRRRCGFA